MPLSSTTRDAAQRLVDRYPVARAALLPLLHLVQSEQGYVTDEGIAFCAEMVGLTKAEVGAVATFYTMFKREPVGDYLLSVCTNPTCKIAGAQTIYERYQEKLGGHHDAESGVSVEHAECLGICDAAPVVQVNYEMYGPLTVEQADELIDNVRAGSPPPSNWSDEVPGTFKEVEWDLSGAGDGIDDYLAAAARAEVQSNVPPAYRTGETDLPVTHPGGDPKGPGGRLLRERQGHDVTAAPPSIATQADNGQRRKAEEVAPETAGAAQERAETAAHGTPPTPAAGDQPTIEAKGATTAGQTDETVTATDESQVDRRTGGETTERSSAMEKGESMGARKHEGEPRLHDERVAGGVDRGEDQDADDADPRRADTGDTDEEA